MIIETNELNIIEYIGNTYQRQTTQGINICPTDIFMWEPGHYSVDGSKGNNSYRIRLKNLVKVTSNTTYYSNLFETTLSPRACFLIRSFDANSKFVRNIGIINPNTMTSFSTNENEVFLGITIADLVGTAYPSQQLFDFVNDGTIKPFICLNSESDKMFEEFIPNSPSPDYPSLIETATGDININVFNRNLLIEQGLSTPKSNTDFWHTPNSNFINFTPLKDGWGKYELDNSKGNTSLYASAFIKLGNIRNIKPNTLYTFLIEFRNINIDGIVDFLINDAYGANISYFSRLAPINDIKNSTIKNVKTAISIQDLNTAITSLRNVANFTAGSSGSFEARVMIVEGTFTLEEIGEYVEYKSQNYLLSLGNIELCKIGEKKDRIYKQDNKWYLEKNTCRYVLDGVNNSFNRDPLQTGLQYYSFYTLAFSNFIKPSSIILCSHLKQQNRILYEDIEGITVNSSGAIRIKLLKPSVTTVAQLLNYLQSNAFEIICELTQSITTEITDETLLEQLETLYNIELFDGLNYIAIGRNNSVQMHAIVQYLVDDDEYNFCMDYMFIIDFINSIPIKPPEQPFPPEPSDPLPVPKINYLKVNELLKREIYNTHNRLIVLRSDETIDYEIPQEDIILDSVSYNENYNQGERRNLSSSLFNAHDRYTLNVRGIWVNTKFRYDEGIEDIYTKQIYWFQKGVFVLSDPDSTHNNSDQQITYNFRDKWSVLSGPKSTVAYTMEIPRDSNVGEAVQGILNIDDGTGNPIDSIPLYIDPSLADKRTPYLIIKDSGTKLADIILELAHSINAEVFYDEYGVLTILPMIETMQDTKKQILWKYNEDDLENEYISHKTTFLTDEYINEVHVIGNNINGDNVYGVATDDNEESQFSVPRIGLRIADPIEDTNISTEEQARDRAVYELRKAIIRQTQTTIQVLFNPLLTVNSLLSLTTKEYGNVKLVIQSISYSKPVGIMSVACSNLENVTSITDLFIRGGGYLLQDEGEFFILADDFSLIREDERDE